MKEWQKANHNQPPARPGDMALDAHLGNLTRQDFLTPWRNTWESGIGADARNRVKYTQL